MKVAKHNLAIMMSAIAGLAYLSCAETEKQNELLVEDMVVADESEDVYDNRAAEATFQKGDKVLTTSGLNLRSEPSTKGKIRAVMPEEETIRVVGTSPRNGWYIVNFDGIVGWASGKYLRLGLRPNGAVQDATARALSVWGFSYHWGGGDWDPTSQNPGSCKGSCPECTHKGKNGADCSGFVAKVWEVPSSNKPVTKPDHPYTTKEFMDIPKGAQWGGIRVSDVREGDAMVWRNKNNSAGHIFYVYGKDSWGKYRAVECKDCATGCLYNVRGGGGYVGRRRHGY